MNVNGPSLRIATPLPADAAPQQAAPGGDAPPPLSLDNPALGGLASVQDGQAAIRTMMKDLGAVRDTLLRELETLLARKQDMPPQQRAAIQDRMEQKLTIMLAQTARSLSQMAKHEELSQHAVSAAIAQFARAAGVMAADVDAMRGGSGGGKLA